MFEVRWGPLDGTRVVLEPGGSLRVGRNPRCRICLDQDRQLSLDHFEVTWDGSSCRVRDLRSTRGTYLNGERVAEALVPHGGWIRAGTSNFIVYFEDHTPPRVDADVAMTPVKQRALAALQGEADPLFAVLDASRSDRILELLRESPEEFRSLYIGTKGEALAEYAPHLVALPKGTKLLPKLVAEGWGKRWGIFATSRRPFKEVRQQFRRLLMVRDDATQKPLYFRFYDPGVLRVVLPTAYPRQRAAFFGEVSAVLYEEADGGVGRSAPERLGAGGGWRISVPQMRAISQAMDLEHFETDTLPHIHEFSPFDATLLGDTRLRQVIRLGIERAKHYGITNPGHLRLYIEIMLMYGSFFDTDPLHPWASETLQDPTIQGSQGRMDRLHEKMLWYYENISGPHRMFDIEALRSSDRVFVQGSHWDEATIVRQLKRVFFEIHSRRAAYAGEDRLAEVASRATEVAKHLKVATTDGVSMVALLMFTKGHRFGEDPLLPWVPSALNARPGDEPSERAKRLELAFYEYWRGTAIWRIDDGNQ